MNATTAAERRSKAQSPNRPTPVGYCANCGSTGACKSRRRTGTIDECSNQHPRPITLAWHQQETRSAAVKAMTMAEAKHLLDLFTYHSPDAFDRFTNLNGHPQPWSKIGDAGDAGRPGAGHFLFGVGLYGVGLGGKDVAK